MRVLPNFEQYWNLARRIKAATKMDSLKVEERADETRIRISGILNGTSVEILRQVWQRSMSDSFWRHFSVDLSELTGYDAAGELLLRQLHNWGSLFSAPTPLALQFLREISRPVRNLVASNYRVSDEMPIHDGWTDDLLDHVSMSNSLMRLSAQCNLFVDNRSASPSMRKRPAGARSSGATFRKAAAS
jgi:hypothetical protein